MNASALPRYIDEKEYCAIRGCKVGTARNERWRGAGPPVYRIGGRQVRYKFSEVIAWIENFKVEPREGAR